MTTNLLMSLADVADKLEKIENLNGEFSISITLENSEFIRTLNEINRSYKDNMSIEPNVSTFNVMIGNVMVIFNKSNV